MAGAQRIIGESHDGNGFRAFQKIANGIDLLRLGSHGLYSSAGGLTFIRVFLFLFEHSQRQLADCVGNFFVAGKVLQVRDQNLLHQPE